MRILRLTYELLFVTLAMISIGCSNQGNKQLLKIENNNDVILELKKAKEKIEDVRDELAKKVIDKNDKETPYKLLVEQKKAEEIKQDAIRILSKYQIIEDQLEPLNLIKDSCENQGIEWDEYCFNEMPWFGVEPILNNWIGKYEKTIKRLKLNTVGNKL